MAGKAALKKAHKLIKEYSQKSRADLKAGQTQGIQAIQDAVAQGRTDLTAGKEEGLGYLAPIAARANQGADLYGNFYGLGGQSGYDTAQSNFESSPLYKSMVGESSMGQQALDRQAMGRGNPYNATDTLKYQGDLAGRYVNDYIGGLRPYVGQAQEVAGAQAGLASGTGTNLASQGMSGGLGQSDVYTGTAQNLAQNNLGSAQLFGQNAQNRAQFALGQQELAQKQQMMNAGENPWNMILGLANPLASVAGAGIKAGGFGALNPFGSFGRA